MHQDPLGTLSRYPTVTLSHSPTPLEALPNLSRHAGGANIWIKRDDCTGLALGGNKVRKLEYYVGEARAQGADTLLITGAVQSNYIRMTVAAARRCGMDCHVQLEERVASPDPNYRNSGNVLLDRLMGATIHSYPVGEDEAGADRNLHRIADSLRAQGKSPYVIALGPGGKQLGALGYVHAARELHRQLAGRDLTMDEIVVATGSGQTHAGLLFGLRALGHTLRVTGICVRRNAKLQYPRVRDLFGKISSLLEIASPATEADIHLDDDFLAPGYGKLNPATLRAIQAAAQSEGILTDPVYSGKSMAGLLHRAQALVQTPGPEKNVLFIHTGGAPSIFAYEPELTGALEGSSAV